MGPDDVLRKGSGSLCEALLCVQAFKDRIIFPNKSRQEFGKTYKGHLLEQETYVGGHVESLREGVFRADIPLKFDIDVGAYEKLIDTVAEIVRFGIEVEGRTKLSDVVNFEDIKSQIKAGLVRLMDLKTFSDSPLIYHMDVAAMYPNIILTNRLQPTAIADSARCAACDFNGPESNCKRPMLWHWVGEYYPATNSEFMDIRNDCATEPIKITRFDKTFLKPFTTASDADQHAKVSGKLKEFCRKKYRRILERKTEDRTEVVCMREHPFYVDTVRDFRDRRNTYKKKLKQWRTRLDEETERNDVMKAREAADMCVLYESLQLAHKCILNSFYGYVMRKGSRWFSSKMAGIVCATGASIIKKANEMLNRLGASLELDTDGVWCALPKSFPDKFNVLVKDGTGTKKACTLNFPCAMLNYMVHTNFSNHQYQTLKDKDRHIYDVHSECSIGFEIDGPYHAMIIPAAREEGKRLKKRYAVYHANGVCAELKGFEIKRRGELKMIKQFQEDFFRTFLDGTTLQECYDAIGRMTNHWLDILYTRGVSIEDDELIEMLSEQTNMSKKLEDYGDRKSSATTTARRIGEFLGDQMIKEAGLACKYVVAKYPESSPVSERAIPTMIFNAEDALKRQYLRKWCKTMPPSLDIRDIMDWDYYIERMSNLIQKLVVIPAGRQGVLNPVPRVLPPDWIIKKDKQAADARKQVRIETMFAKKRGTVDEGSPKKPRIGGDDDDDVVEIIDDLDENHEIDRDDDDDVDQAPLNDDQEHVDVNDNEANDAAFAASKNNALVPPPPSSIPVPATINDKVPEGETVRKVERFTLKTHEFPAVKKKNKGIHLIDHDPILDSPPPSISNFGVWHAWQKNRWRFLRRQKKERREFERNPSTNKRRVLSANVINPAAIWSKYLPDGASRILLTKSGASAKSLDMFKISRTLMPKRGYWEILQITHTLSPGVFGLWVIGEDCVLQKVTVTVPRIFYINFREKPEKVLANSRFVKRNLPHGRTLHHLLQVSMSEAAFRNDEQKNMILFTGAHVEGVYELQVPLMLRALLTLGCVVSPSSKTASGLHHYNLSDLKFQHVSTCPYLDVNAIRVLYLFEAVHNDNHGVIALFDADDRKAWIFYLDPGRQPNPNVKAEYSKFIDDDNDSIDFKSVSHVTSDAVFKDVNKLIRTLLTEHTGDRMMMLVQSQYSLESLSKRLNNLESLPTVPVPFYAADAQLPPLLWKSRVMTTAVRRFVAASPWFADCLGTVRYAHIPIGNLGMDQMPMCADVMYGRYLLQNQHLLWMCPDAGCDELQKGTWWAADRMRVVADGADAAYYSDPRVLDVEKPIISNAGFYRDFCTEIDVVSLAVNSLYESKLVHDVAGSLEKYRITDEESKGVVTRGINPETGAAVTAVNNSSDKSKPAEAIIVHDTAAQLDSSTVLPALGILKSLVCRWVGDTAAQGNKYADLLLVHFYRWLRSPSSFFHDPALYKLLHSLMKKVFVQMVHKMTSLGLEIVYADFTRLTVHVPRITLTSSRMFLENIKETLSNDPMFEWMDFTVLKWWRSYLFADSCNYLGYLYDDYNIDDITALSSGKFVDSLHLGTVLHPDLQTYFQFMLAEYVAKTDSKKSELVRERLSLASSAAPIEQGHDIPDDMHAQLTAQDRHKIDAQVVEYCKSFINGHMTQRFLRFLEDVKVKAAEGLPYPVVPGQSRALGPPELELVKFCCYILAVDVDISDEISVLRRTLLRNIGVREFAKEAVFQEPTTSLILPDVTCSWCSSCRDIDLCRDRIQGGTTFACLMCGCEYEKRRMQDVLLRLVYRKIKAFYSQEMKCTRCHRVRSGQLTTQCKCSGHYVLTREQSEIETMLRVVQSIAVYYKFLVIEDTVNWYLKAYETK